MSEGAAVKVAVTGAAGQIGYALLFRIASGQMLGPDTKVALRLLEIPAAVKASWSDGVKVLVVGNPANTNALILSSNAPDIPKTQITAMTRLDQNRAVALLAQKLQIGVDEVADLVVWGNHSPSMFPDLFNATVNGKRAVDLVDMDWYESEYIPRVGKRGAEVIAARGSSSAASAANAAIDHVRDWVSGAEGLRSMAVASDGSYGIAEGIISSFPVRCTGGAYEIVQGLQVGDFAQAKIDATVKELTDERAAVSELGLI